MVCRSVHLFAKLFGVVVHAFYNKLTRFLHHYDDYSQHSFIIHIVINVIIIIFTLYSVRFHSVF